MDFSFFPLVASGADQVPFIDNTSVLTVGIVLQIFGIAGLTWKIAQLNTELQVRLHRLEYDANNIASKVRDNLVMIEKQNTSIEVHKKKLNDLIGLINQNNLTDVDHL